jgi:hypothetical protein
MTACVASRRNSVHGPITLRADSNTALSSAHSRVIELSGPLEIRICGIGQRLKRTSSIPAKWSSALSAVVSFTSVAEDSALNEKV